MRKGHRTVETLKAGVGFCLRDTISDVVSAVGKGQCPVQDASVTEAGALKEEQLEASEQLANHNQAIHVVTDFDSTTGLEVGMGDLSSAEGDIGAIL